MLPVSMQFPLMPPEITRMGFFMMELVFLSPCSIVLLGIVQQFNIVWKKGSVLYNNKFNTFLFMVI